MKRTIYRPKATYWFKKLGVPLFYGRLYSGELSVSDSPRYDVLGSMSYWGGVIVAKVKMEKVYSHQDGLIHISSMGLIDPASTLCLDVDVMDANYEKSSGKVTCAGCKSTFNALKDGMTLR